MTEREALKLALEALRFALHVGFDESSESQIKKGDKAVQQHQNAITAIREALAQPEQEPVAGQPLPCPFCGHIGLDFSDGNTYRWGIASCGGCGASCGDIRREYPDEGKWHSEAIAEWNKRTIPPSNSVNSIKSSNTLDAQRKPLTDEQWQVIADTLDCLITRKQKDAIEAVIGIKE